MDILVAILFSTVVLVVFAAKRGARRVMAHLAPAMLQLRAVFGLAAAVIPTPAVSMVTTARAAATVEVSTVAAATPGIN
jgi:beta-lactamase regulating signal transducer with metallopeptidase domain